jgi:hypothetical protein
MNDRCGFRTQLFAATEQIAESKFQRINPEPLCDHIDVE